MKHLLLSIWFLTTTVLSFAQTNKVYLIPTLYELHKTNRQYSYDSLRSVISRVQPDIIAVEVRSEDMNSDSDYLKRNYPYEMWMVKYWFPGAAVKGFGWLGADLEGEPVPNRYWQDQSRIKYLQRRLEIDSEFTAKLKNCRLYEEERMKFFRYGSLKTIYKSNTGILTKAYYDCLNGQLQNSDYEELTRFYDKQNELMQQKITALLKEQSGKTLVILTGVNHYPFLLQHLRNANIKVEPGLLMK